LTSKTTQKQSSNFENKFLYLKNSQKSSAIRYLTSKIAKNQLTRIQNNDSAKADQFRFGDLQLPQRRNQLVQHSSDQAVVQVTKNEI
jgi:hypothetical protein